MTSDDPIPTTNEEGSPDETITSDGTLVSSAANDVGLPERIGPYRVLRLLGEGGMGVVYEAEQERPRRTVALKIIRPGLATPRMLRRFQLEAEVLGHLQHPGIAQVFEAGTAVTPIGVQPYFAMELIRGVNLTEHVRKNVPSPRERLDMLARICDAVQHAHQKGVIHRDLKPANVLIDSTGQPKILDFGVARATDADLQVTTQQTDVGQIIGTLQYMSPEQVAAVPDDLDTRSDVYALGVIAHELLSGAAPYDLKNKMIHEVARVITEEEPTRLSVINRSFRGDVETIVAKALEKDRSRRYQSAAELATDIRHYLNDEPIVARPSSAIYQFRKFTRRHRAFVVGVAAVFVVLVTGIILTSWQYVVAEAARATAEEQRTLAERRKDEAVAARADAQTRAEQLTTVTQFQQSVLADIDAEAMGRGILAAQRTQIREVLEKTNASPEDVKASLAPFDTLIRNVNATNLALTVVNEHVLAQATAAIEKEFVDQPLVRAALQQTLATTCRGLGLLQEAMSLQDAAMQTRLAELGEENAETLTSIDEMGSLLVELGRLAEAETYYRRALAGRRRVLGGDNRETLVSINNVGLALYWQGKPEETLPFYEEAVESGRRVLGNDDTNTLTALNNLSILLMDLGREKEALANLLEISAGQRRALGEDHPDTLVAEFNVCYAYHHMEDYEKALECYRGTLASARRVRGDDHPKTALVKNAVGVMLNKLGRLGEAVPYCREALDARRRTLGDDHMDTLISINNLGDLLNQTGQYEEASRLMQTSLPDARRVLGEQFPGLLGVFLERLGQAEAGLSAFQSAEAALLESYPLLVARFGEGSERTREVIESLVALYESWDKAEPDQSHDVAIAEWQAKLVPPTRASESAKTVGD